MHFNLGHRNDLCIRFTAFKQHISKGFYASLVVEIHFYPRSDGLEKVGNSKNWEVEDFLPIDVVFEGINRILKRAKYRIISKQYRDKKTQPSNIDKPILSYAENACSMINADKNHFPLQGSGQKMSLCQHIHSHQHSIFSDNSLAGLR